MAPPAEGREGANRIGAPIHKDHQAIGDRSGDGRGATGGGGSNEYSLLVTGRGSPVCDCLTGSDNSL
eukprot:3885297-Lingulodinium_polyedra.AAC.1